MKVVYKSAIVDNIIETINNAFEQGWLIEHIKLTRDEWYRLNSYLVLLKWPAVPERIVGGGLMFHGVKIIREG